MKVQVCNFELDYLPFKGQMSYIAQIHRKDHILLCHYRTHIVSDTREIGSLAGFSASFTSQLYHLIFFELLLYWNHLHYKIRVVQFLILLKRYLEQIASKVHLHRLHCVCHDLDVNHPFIALINCNNVADQKCKFYIYKQQHVLIFSQYLAKYAIH